MRLDLPPDEADYLDLPASFGRRFAVFVDTEEEFDWTKPFRRDGYGTLTTRSLPTLQARFDAVGVRPVYLVDYPIAGDAESVRILRRFRDEGRCEIGTQLHPWVTPPFDEEVTVYNSFAGNLPIELERAKLVCITEAITEAFGERPTLYRAGRYGVGPNSANLLGELGYRADTSVRSYHSYREQGGPSFAKVKPIPFRVGEGLIELPLSVGFTGVARRWGPRAYRLAGRVSHGHGALARLGLVQRVALSPEEMPASAVKAAIDALLADDIRLLTISFHSPSVEPGHTPYVRTAGDLDRFYLWWDEIFAHLANRGVAPAALDEIYEAAGAARTRGQTRAGAGADASLSPAGGGSSGL
jgi:hypothetical protein